MPIIIPNDLPATDILKRENFFVMSEGRAGTQDIRTLEILVVNLMPTKIATETQIARMLANSPIQVRLTLLRTETHQQTHTSQKHLDTFYKTFDEVKDRRFDGMILTGAPLDFVDFEDVDYWDEITKIMDWSQKNIYTNFYLCWGAFAALYYYFGIHKTINPGRKKFLGIYEHKVTRRHNPLVRGFDEYFMSPVSRACYVKREEVLEHPELRILADSEETGPALISTENGRQIFMLCHNEYGRKTLAEEYWRDRNSKGIDVDVPVNYFKDDDPDGEIRLTWRSHGNLLYSNWLNYYVYQESPYDYLTNKNADWVNYERDRQ